MRRRHDPEDRLERIVLVIAALGFAFALGYLAAVAVGGAGG